MQVTKKAWVLKNKETGKFYPNFTYPTRSAARKAAKGQRFKGQYTPAQIKVMKHNMPKTKDIVAHNVMKKEVTPIETQTQTTKVLNRTQILRKSSGFNSFPIHQRWM